jgi:long-subunit acyl-CoA synthetase (AMP-forming)
MKVYNTYGPSEMTCIISFGELNADEEPPCGDLIPGVKVVLVDEDLREYDHGEAMIADPGLAAGYLNNPELTANNFIQWNGERFYRTGDLARRMEKGQLVWAGRAILSLRIEGS